MDKVTATGLGKKYGNTPAIANITFAAHEGEIFGFIGPDGAGKTTVFRILTTLLLPDTGTATVDGFDVVSNYRQIRKRVGYMPGRFSLYHDLSVEENLQFFATLFNTTIQENYHLIADIYTQIEPFKTRRAGKLSGGMKQKLALCCALIHRPSVLFLDEPTTGVDAVSRREFWDMLKRLKTQGITILVSTPYMDEAALCDRVALMQKGSILTINTPQDIVNNFSKPLRAVKAGNTYQLLNDLLTYQHTADCYAFGDVVHLTLKNNPESTDQMLLQFLQSKGHTNAQITAITPNIEDCFMDLL